MSWKSGASTVNSLMVTVSLDVDVDFDLVCVSVSVTVAGILRYVRPLLVPDVHWTTAKEPELTTLLHVCAFSSGSQ